MFLIYIYEKKLNLWDHIQSNNSYATVRKHVKKQEGKNTRKYFHLITARKIFSVGYHYISL